MGNKGEPHDCPSLMKRVFRSREEKGNKAEPSRCPELRRQLKTRRDLDRQTS
jgi:hypothetical protein